MVSIPEKRDFCPYRADCRDGTSLPQNCGLTRKYLCPEDIMRSLDHNAGMEIYPDYRY